jgi:glycerol kinase
MAIIDRGGRIVAEAHNELRPVQPQHGWLEYDPNEIWAYIEGSLPDLITGVTLDMSHVAAIGIAGRPGPVVLWDPESGEPICNAIAADCPRTASVCERLAAMDLELTVRRKTGLPLTPRSSAAKIVWALDNVDGARERAQSGDVLCGTLDSWLAWRLTGGRAHVTDHTNASRTLLYDIHARAWDEDLLAAFGIPLEMLPSIRPSSGAFAQTSGTRRTPAGLLIGGIVAGEAATLFAQGCHHRGTAKLTFADACVPVLNTGDEVVEPAAGVAATTVCGPTGEPLYALEAQLPLGATIIDWLRDGLGVIESGEEAATLAGQADDAGGVRVIPAAGGGGRAAGWDILGLSADATRAQVVRASLEAVAHQAADALQAMAGSAGVGLQTVRADGPGARNDFLLQFEADMLDVLVERPVHLATRLMGAGFIAGLAAGFWTEAEETVSLLPVEQRFQPQMPHGERTRRRTAWREGLAAAQGLHAPPAPAD